MHSTPPKKKVPGKESDPFARKRPAAADTSKTPAASDTPDQSPAPSREEVVTNWSKPVTNQDEQDKITNAGEGDIPIANK